MKSYIIDPSVVKRAHEMRSRSDSSNISDEELDLLKRIFPKEMVSSETQSVRVDFSQPDAVIIEWENKGWRRKR
jgi:hypothetical protein